MGGGGGQVVLVSRKTLAGMTIFFLIYKSCLDSATHSVSHNRPIYTRKISHGLQKLQLTLRAKLTL